jgi:hypothetical protein
LLVNWLTLVTEFIGMTSSLRIFGVPPLGTQQGLEPVTVI